MIERKVFEKKITVICDTREQCNQHIIQFLHANGIATESRKLDFGDYSFEINGKCFERSCIVERKGSVDELFGNFVHDRERIQKEFDAAAKNARHMELILEGVTSEEELKAFEIPEKQMIAQNRKVQRIGETVYFALRSLRSGNRCGLQVSFVRKKIQPKSCWKSFTITIGTTKKRLHRYERSKNNDKQGNFNGSVVCRPGTQKHTKRHCCLPFSDCCQSAVQQEQRPESGFYQHRQLAAASGICQPIFP